MAVLASDQASVPDAATSRAHPLEPLTAAEIEAAAAAVTAAAGLRPSARFVYISLYEPTKADVIAFEAGGPAPERQVKLVLRERAERASYEGIVAVDRAEVQSWRRVEGVQPSVMFEEFLAAEETVRADPRWQQAMRRRGVTDFSLCMIDPWSSPNVAPGLGPQDGHHLRWQKWDLRIGFTAREGLVLHRIGYHDGGTLRSVIHRASLSEMFVPYADP